MACADPDVDLGSAPLTALNVTVRTRLGLFLNPRTTVAPDWTVLAEEVGFTYLEIKNFEARQNPTAVVLDEWQARFRDATVGKLLGILEKLERNDILEDLRCAIGDLQLMWKLVLLAHVYSKHSVVVIYRSVLIRVISGACPVLVLPGNESHASSSHSIYH